MDLKLYCRCTAFHGDCFCSVVPCLNRRFDCVYISRFVHMIVFVMVCNVQPCYPVIKLNITLSVILTKEFVPRAIFWAYYEDILLADDSFLSFFLFSSLLFSFFLPSFPLFLPPPCFWSMYFSFTVWFEDYFCRIFVKISYQYIFSLLMASVACHLLSECRAPW